MISSETAAVARARSDNQATVQSYERSADEYAQTTHGPPSPAHGHLFETFIRRVGAGGRVVEIGSGPGWDADRLEAAGIDVLRTDVTQAFIELQRKRGKRVERLDLISDDLDGQHDGILCLYVLQHIARPLVPRVLEKIARALRQGGFLLIGLRQGGEDVYEDRASSDGYHVTVWPAKAFLDQLAEVGLIAEDTYVFVGKDGEWLTLLARRE